MRDIDCCPVSSQHLIFQRALTPQSRQPGRGISRILYPERCPQAFEPLLLVSHVYPADILEFLYSPCLQRGHDIVLLPDLLRTIDIISICGRKIVQRPFPGMIMLVIEAVGKRYASFDLTVIDAVCQIAVSEPSLRKIGRSHYSYPQSQALDIIISDKTQDRSEIKL